MGLTKSKMANLKLGLEPTGNSKELMLRKNMNKNRSLTGQIDFTEPLYFVLVQNKHSFEFRVPRFTQSLTYYSSIFTNNNYYFSIILTSGNFCYNHNYIGKIPIKCILKFTTKLVSHEIPLNVIMCVYLTH